MKSFVVTVVSLRLLVASVYSEISEERATISSVNLRGSMGSCKFAATLATCLVSVVSSNPEGN